MVDMDDFILRSYLLYAQQDPGLLAQAAAAHGLCPAADFATAKPQVEPMQAQYTNETSKG
jgi:hypothetical protein